MGDSSYCIAIDFDGTVTDVDIIDAVLDRFARPEWRSVETLWEQGMIGSRECLERQISLVEQPLSRLIEFIDRFPVDRTFAEFARFLEKRQVPFAIVSDGFQIFIERILANAGLKNIPILANVLLEEKGRLKTVFPFSDPECRSANCKCTAVAELSKGRSLIAIGDGRSDFCIAQNAAHVFSKGKLTEYCRDNAILHTAFDDFSEVKKCLLKKRTFALPLDSISTGKD